MHYFCHLDLSGDLEHTNLQLYSLKKAADAWNELIDAISDSDMAEVDHFRERLAFIMSCFGLSLSQLIGQNCPSPEKDKMDQPGDLLAQVLKRTTADRTTKRQINATFGDFLRYYGAIRHFGRNRDEKNYNLVENLTLVEVDRFRNMTIRIWDLVIGIYRQDPTNDIDEDVSSVTGIVRFRERPEPDASADG